MQWVLKCLKRLKRLKNWWSKLNQMPWFFKKELVDVFEMLLFG